MGAKFTTFVMDAVLLITFLGLISMIFNLHRFAFYGEFLILLVLLLAGVVSAIGVNNNFRWAWILLALFFAFVFINMLFIYVITTVEIPYFLILLVVAVVGFFISLFSIEKEKTENDSGKIKKGEIKVEKVEAEKVYAAKKEVKKTFKPGKYIASKTGTKFHAPKCDWAKKIKKDNAVWFNYKEDAQKAGYKEDSCIK